MDKDLKDQKLRIFTTEEDLANMVRHKDKFVEKMGQDTYDRLVKQLEDHVSRRKQPQSLCQGMETNQKVDLIIEALKKEFYPLRVFLFGSRANGNASSDSDFDFVVVVKETNKTRIENMRRARALVREVAGVSADVFVYDQSEFDKYKDELSSVPETALNTGRELDLG